MSEHTPGFEGLGMPGDVATLDAPPDRLLDIEPTPGISEDLLHPGATGVRRPRAMRIAVPSGTPVVLLVSSGPSDRPRQMVSMPQLRHVGVEKASRRAAKLGLTLQASPTYAPGIGENRVVVQYPDAGRPVAEGSTVSVLISNGRKPPKGLESQLPDVVGALAADAETSVLAAGLRPVVLRTPHPTVLPEIVFAQLPSAHVAAHHGAALGARAARWIVTAAVIAVVVGSLAIAYAAIVR